MLRCPRSTCKSGWPYNKEAHDRDDPVLDFTSALYLGLDHATRSLPPWERLTLGKPAALETPPGAGDLEKELAGLVGCERALLAPSTLHLFWDLFAILAARDVNIFLDAGTYPIARWGVERAAASDVPVRAFRQHDLRSLRSALEAADRRRPVIVADGYCPACGTAAPVAEYLAFAAPRDGLVVVDDTQALGIFGHSPGFRAPYGKGGGGSLQRAGLHDPRVLQASSLAKAFGVPIAVLAGSHVLVSEYEERSKVRVHCSPPSAAVIAAAAHALEINRRCGDTLRLRLAHRVAHFRRGLRALNLAAVDGLFPVQPLRLPEGIEARSVYEELSECGVQTVLYRGSDSALERVSFVISARHTWSEIEHAQACLATVITGQKRFTGGKDNARSTKNADAGQPRLGRPKQNPRAGKGWLAISALPQRL
jgi:8-amino-7-oxononanoate synthase